ncbi:MAG: hypothetical protein KGL53_02360 [Elusimicrobia bacterium]|nr:hypothetical protein [Elusimicrobiota bacterium]
MKRTSSMIWILFLLAALFLGPALILRHGPSARAGRPSLREAAMQEHLLDAPRDVPAAAPAAP